MAFGILVGLIPGAYAAGFSVAGEEGAVTYENGVYTIVGDATITGTSYKDQVVVAQSCSITLDNATIKYRKAQAATAYSETLGSPLTIRAGCDVTLVLVGKNQLYALAAGPGILVEDDARLTIQGGQGAELIVEGAWYDSYEDMGWITSAIVGGSAGIGGPNRNQPYNYTGSIVVESGDLQVTGYGYGAGIGGGNNGSSGTIEICGGRVHAENVYRNDWGSPSAAGIGSSQGMPANDIVLSGGQIYAYGGKNMPGIGGDEKGNISILSGTLVRAYGGEDAAGIGAGSHENFSEIVATIESGADVQAFATESILERLRSAITAVPSDTSSAKILCFSIPDFGITGEGIVRVKAGDTTMEMPVHENYTSFACTVDVDQCTVEIDDELALWQVYTEQEKEKEIPVKTDFTPIQCQVERLTPASLKIWDFVRYDEAEAVIIAAPNEMNVLLIFGIYDQTGRLISMESRKETLFCGSNKRYTTTTFVPGSQDKVRVMVWENFDSLKPLCDEWSET